MTPSQQQKAGKAVRHQFSAGDVLFVKVLTEFPFPLSKQDKQSLAQVLARGNRRAARWSTQGSDLVYRSGEMQVLIACKPFRQTVARNLAAYRWEESPFSEEPAFPCIMLHRCFGRACPNKRSQKTFAILMLAIWHMLACSLVLAKSRDARKSGWQFEGSMGPFSDPFVAG